MVTQLTHSSETAASAAMTSANEILRIIGESKTETLLWSNHPTIQSRIAKKRADFLMNTQQQQQHHQQQQTQPKEQQRHSRQPKEQQRHSQQPERQQHHQQPERQQHHQQSERQQHHQQLERQQHHQQSERQQHHQQPERQQAEEISDTNDTITPYDKSYPLKEPQQEDVVIYWKKNSKSDIVTLENNNSITCESVITSCQSFMECIDGKQLSPMQNNKKMEESIVIYDEGLSHSNNHQELTDDLYYTDSSCIAENNIYDEGISPSYNRRYQEIIPDEFQNLSLITEKEADNEQIVYYSMSKLSETLLKQNKGNNSCDDELSQNSNKMNDKMLHEEDFQSILDPQSTTAAPKPLNIVRRNSSSDSGIVVRTPSDKMNKEQYAFKQQLFRSKTVDVSEKHNGNDCSESHDCKQQTSCHRSNSLPTHEELDKLKSVFPLENMKKNFLNSSSKSRNGNLDSCLLETTTTTTTTKTSQNKNLFDITNILKQSKRNNRRRQRRTRSMSEHHDVSRSDVIILSCDINFTDNLGDSCLHHASSAGDVETIRHLLKQGGNVWQKNNKDCLPLDVCTDFKTAKLLSEATIFYTDHERHTKDTNISSTVKLAFDL